MWILDASVAIKWFFTDEHDRERAVAVLQKLTDHPDQFAAPSFFFCELTAVLTRRSKYDVKMVQESLSAVYQLGIAVFELGEELARHSLSLACAHKISFYDAIYAALAQQCKARWLTADEKALAHIPKNLGLSLKAFS